MLRFACPSCGKHLKAPHSSAGTRCRCTRCHKLLLVPVAPPEEEPVPGIPLRGRNSPAEADYTEPPPVRRSSTGTVLDSPTKEPDPLAGASKPSERGADEKYCHECGAVIRFRAEICPHCGVRQPQAALYELPHPSASGVTIPLLVSAISNIVVGLLWCYTCLGVILAIPMFLLCIYEFALWARADSMSLPALASSAKARGILEIIVGLANTPTLICGIIILINAGKLQSASEY
jgi:hypothetical protein